MGLLERFSEFSASTRFDVLPDDVVRHLKRYIIGTIGVTLCGSREESMVRLEKFILNGVEGKGEVTVIGSSRKASLPGAALLNGSRANVYEFADANEVCGAHPGGVTIPLAYLTL